jgi:hypothetical protein
LFVNSFSGKLGSGKAGYNIERVNEMLEERGNTQQDFYLVEEEKEELIKLIKNVHF